MTEDRYKARMLRKQQVMQARIDAADEDRGVVLVLTGNGKGKSSSAFGMLARALGHGMRAGVVQFIKAAGRSGEEVFFARQPEVEFYSLGEGFSWDTQDKTRDQRSAQRAWQKAQQMLSDAELDLVVLDELNIVLKRELLSVDEVLAAIQKRPPHQHLVITGRHAPGALVEIADTVSEVQNIKHAFKTGVRAQRGIDR